MLLLIIIFLAAMILTAAILAMGAIPEIFRQTELINQTLIQQYEDKARQQQADIILNHMDEEINNLQTNLTLLMLDSENRNNQSFNERVKIVEGISQLIENTEDFASQNLNLTKMNKQNIEDILKNVSAIREIDKKVNSTNKLVKDINDTISY